MRNCVRSRKTIDTHHCELIERPGILDVLQRLLQILQLLIHNALGLLGTLQRLGLESLNCLDLPCHIDSLGLEVVESLLDLIHNGGVFQDAAVVGEVDSLRLLAEHEDLPARIIVALLEGLEGSGSVSFETKLGRELGPVELESGAALLMIVALVSA